MGLRYVRVLVENRPRFGRLDGAIPGSSDPGAGRIELLTASPFEGGSPDGTQLPLATAQLLPACTPSKIVAVGTNYRAHAAEMEKPLPDEPLLFLKPPSALLAPGAPIVRPRGYQRTDFEGELGVVIARRARHLTEAQADAHIFGYTIVNDVTVRDLQKKDGQFTRAKGFDSFCPVGPWIVAGIAPDDLRLRTRRNGVVEQDARTSDLIFGVRRLVAFISRVMTLEPGDLISTGTPSGVGPIAPGDTIEIEIENIGTLSNPVVEETLP